MEGFESPGLDHRRRSCCRRPLRSAHPLLRRRSVHHVSYVNFFHHMLTYEWDKKTYHSDCDFRTLDSDGGGRSATSGRRSSLSASRRGGVANLLVGSSAAALASVGGDVIGASRGQILGRSDIALLVLLVAGPLAWRIAVASSRTCCSSLLSIDVL